MSVTKKRRSWEESIEIENVLIIKTDEKRVFTITFIISTEIFICHLVLEISVSNSSEFMRRLKICLVQTGVSQVPD